MSLKAFHIAFIGLSALLAVGVTLWSAMGYIRTGDSVYLLAAFLSLAAAAGLVFYSFRFLRKLKQVSFF